MSRAKNDSERSAWLISLDSILELLALLHTTSLNTLEMDTITVVMETESVRHRILSDGDRSTPVFPSIVISISTCTQIHTAPEPCNSVIQFTIYVQQCSMEFSLSKPKRKRWCSHPILPPFPIPLEDFPPENPSRNVFCGQLHGSVVFVSHSGDKHYLYNRVLLSELDGLFCYLFFDFFNKTAVKTYLNEF
ncbi:hypothetical protein CAPTEDRAFT_196037 [Capitella teleta]|uniref:PH domain-containing protein n=1 Tax=Capitella teleta TaxID=283909 RepID=R7TU85_CAPTE|nr:hypothetical protein CAPTEDRAFT_196037 [Capitella teleta]|eukprot:ELT97157.1 hypothetical protein CAPTEDRAFT_196037 [Capitella teleta]